jgi:hypothetical protein
VAAHLPHIASLLRPRLEDVVDESDVLVIANGDDEFARLPELMRFEQALVDLTGLLGTPEPERRRIGGARS